MKQRREYTDYLRDILDAISKIDKFTEGMDADRFMADEKTVFAGEAKGAKGDVGPLVP